LLRTEQQASEPVTPIVPARPGRESDGGREMGQERGRHGTMIVLPVFVLVRVLLAAVGACGQVAPTAAWAPSPTGEAAPAGAMPVTPTNMTIPGVPTKPGGVPTPAPSVTIPPITPQPTQSAPPQKPTPVKPAQPQPTPRPETPIHVIGYGDGIPDTRLATQGASLVIIGTVKQVLPARWTTPDGRRPANPYDRSDPQLIYTPVLIEVEQYLKGGQSQREVLIFGSGGVVGEDSFEDRGGGLITFQEGERVLLFLDERVRNGVTLNGAPLWRQVSTHYRLTPDGQATNGYHTLPLQQLFGEIITAVSAIGGEPGVSSPWLSVGQHGAEAVPESVR
jgi:hypothetical protein